jgi:hypothetical protein
MMFLPLRAVACRISSFKRGGRGKIIYMHLTICMAAEGVTLFSTSTLEEMARTEPRPF